MSLIETKYISLVGPFLRGFKKKKDGLFNFACPYCGDSQYRKTKLRGYFYIKRSDYFFKCHNCGVGRTLGNFLKDNNKQLYNNYILERYKEGLTGSGSNCPEPKINWTTNTSLSKIADNSFYKNLIPIKDLNTDTLAKQYIIRRQIPESFYDKIFFCEKFKSWTNTQKFTFENTDVEESRIIIPLEDTDGIFGFQARSLNSHSNVKYITVILDDSKPKVYGLNRVDTNKRVFITEGPFDSMFIENSIAMCGADISLDQLNLKWGVFVYDNEPRNKEICKRMQKAIEHGYSLVIWPDKIDEKDINDMVLAGIKYKTIIEMNIFSGLQATLKFQTWKKA